MNTLTFMLTCMQIQFKSSSREIEQQVKQQEAWNLNQLCNVKAQLKKSVAFLKILLQNIVSFPLIQNRYKESTVTFRRRCNCIIEPDMSFGKPLRKRKYQINNQAFYCSEIRSQRYTAVKLSSLLLDSTSPKFWNK